MTIKTGPPHQAGVTIHFYITLTQPSPLSPSHKAMADFARERAHFFVMPVKTGIQFIVNGFPLLAWAKPGLRFGVAWSRE